MFEEEDVEIKKAEPGGICHVMIVAGVEFREHVAQGLLQFLLRVDSYNERFVHGLAELLNGRGRAGAEHVGVGFDPEELRQ